MLPKILPQLADLVMDSIFIHDLDGNILYVNNAAWQTRGYTREELLSMNIRDLEASGSAQRYDVQTADLVREGRLCFESADRCKDGSIMPIEVYACVVQFAGQDLILSVVRDITDRKCAEAAMRQAQEILEQRVQERTAQLEAANLALQAEAESRARLNEELRRSEHRYRDLIDNLPDIFFAMDTTLRYTSWNRASETLTGIAAADAIGRSLYELFPAVKGTPAEKLYLDVLRTGQPQTVINSFRLGEQDFHFELNAYRATDGLAVLARDITARVQAEARARREAMRTQALLRVAAQLASPRDLDGVLGTVCEETIATLGAPAASVALYDAESQSFLLRCVAGLPESAFALFRPIPRALYERYLQRPDGLIVIRDVQAHPELTNAELYRQLDVRTMAGVQMAHEGRLVGILSIQTLGEPRDFDPDDLALMRGIADQAAQAIIRMYMLEELRAGQAKLEALSRRLIGAQEEERRRIARELHDEIGQALTIVKLNLQAARSTASESSTAYLDDSLQVIDRTIQGVRRLSANLRPSLLDDLGLVPALRWYVTQQAERAGLEAHFQTGPADIRLPPEFEIVCFRVAQEAITNVIRHGQATRLDVSLQQTSDKIELIVRDNGVGFDVAQAYRNAATGESLGLVGMQERASLLGGALDIVSGPGYGVEVRLRLPAPQPPAGAPGESSEQRGPA